MIFRLRICNTVGDTARVDIQKGGSIPVYDMDGTEDPFTLFQTNDKNDKSGSFRTSGANINIYETAEFNIDELKTSSETEISVKYYINDVLQWSGFVIPDFFSKQITGGAGVVSMVASDRLSTLKGVTLSGLSAKISNRALAEMCLAKTGLSLPLYTMADFTGDGVNIFNSEVLSQRMIDTKGRSISCYDILSSLLEQTNSILMQRAGAWYIVNKVQLEAGVGTLYSNATTSTAWNENTVNFSEVNVGARRTIIPVASMVGVYHEHGGGRLHPDNYDFSQGLTGWNTVGGFVASTDNRVIESYTIGGTGGAIYTPNYGAATGKAYLINLNQYQLNTNPIYLESEGIDIPYTGSGSIEIEVDVNAIGPAVFPNFAGAYIRVAVVAVSDTETLTLSTSGEFIPMPDINPPLFQQEFDRSTVTVNIPAIAKGMKIKGTLAVSDLSAYNIKLRIYGSGGGRTIIYNSISVVMRNSLEVPKGTMYKREQGANYTKTHEIPTVLWGDYLTNGLDGYFYEYPIDDTSSLYMPDGSLHSKWTAYGDTDQIPLLQHISRQKARMFSVAHDLLTADIDAVNFDPLSIFVDCNAKPKRYVVVSSKVDFLRSRVSVDLEEVVYTNNTVRDLIYSYFGDGEEGIRSIGGISGGIGGGTGGGLTPEQVEILNWWKKDPDNPNTIFTEMNAYSTGELSAYGIGSGGSSGGGVDLLQAWTDYDATKDNWAVKAGLLVPFYNDTKSRLTSLEGGAALSLNVTGSGNAIASLTKSGTALTATKGNFAELDTNGKIISSQLPSYVDDLLEYVNLAAFPATGETGKIYIAQDSNKIYRWSGTAYVEISASLALGETSSTAYRGDRGKIAYDHSQTEHQTIINGVGFVKANGKTLSYDNNSYSLASHNHSGVYEPVFTKNTAFNKNFGTTSGTVAEGNDSRINNGQTAYGWGNHASAGYALNSSLSNYLPLTGGTLTGNLTAPTFIGALNGNADTATKLQTPRTIAGVSFDGTENIAIPFANLSSKPTTLSGYGITDAVAKTSAARIEGAANNLNDYLIGGFYNTKYGIQNYPLPHDGALLVLPWNSPGYVSQIVVSAAGANESQQGLYFRNNLDSTGSTWTSWKEVWNSGNLSPVTTDTAQTISGAKTFSSALTASTSVTTPKVIFTAAGWSMEQSGTEIQFKYNGAIKQRLLSDGTIVGIGEITAFGSAT